MSNTSKARTSRKPTEHKELLVFFPDDYSAVKMSRNKVLGTAQQLSELKANTWADVDVGESQAWKGLIIKTGKSRNELARCELAFLKFLDRHADNKENIPLSNFFEQWENVDNSDDENSCVELEGETKKEIKAKKVKNGVKHLKLTEEPNDVQLEARSTESRDCEFSKGKKGAKTGKKRQKHSDNSVDFQNKQEKKLKRDEACAQATMNRKQSEDIFQQLKNYVQQGSFDESEDEVDHDLFINDSEINVDNADDCLLLNQPNQNHRQSFLEKLQEMFATSTKAIHSRFDDIEKAIALLNDRQQGTEKTLEELASKISGKAKLSRPPPVNVVVSHSSPHPNSGATGASVICATPQTSNVSDDCTPVRKPLRDSNNDPDLDSTTTEKIGYVGNRKFSVKASPESIRRAEELARGVPKALAFNLLNLLVDLKTQSESNISGQNGKKALDGNILAAIQCKLFI
ncbi:uncharacterized protein LOC141892659 [Acropora palmata]|uniref:uncharacterized protein LOC141892659 n=1 Tax=Acropora palmata TaxID=6131 RepID=UPI003DA035BD